MHLLRHILVDIQAYTVSWNTYAEKLTPFKIKIKVFHYFALFRLSHTQLLRIDTSRKD